MKKILFSLAALAALSMVAVGCKKASDAAKLTKMSRVEEGKAVFAAFKKMKDCCGMDATIELVKPEKVKALKAAFKEFKAAVEKIEKDYKTETAKNVKKLELNKLETAINNLGENEDSAKDHKASENATTLIPALTDSSKKDKPLDVTEKAIEEIKNNPPYKN